MLSNLFVSYNVLVSLLNNISREELIFLLIIYALLSWLIAFLLKRSRPKKFSWPFVIFAPFVFPVFAATITVTYLGIETFESLVYFYQNFLGFIFFAATQFFIVIPNTPPSIKSFIFHGNNGSEALFWNHFAQYLVVLISFSIFLARCLWKKIPSAKKARLKKSKFAIFIFLYFFISGVLLFDLLMSQLFVSYKIVVTSLAMSLLGKIISRIYQGKPLPFIRHYFLNQ